MTYFGSASNGTVYWRCVQCKQLVPGVCLDVAVCQKCQAEIGPTAQEPAGATQQGPDVSSTVSVAGVVPEPTSSSGCYACQRRGCAKEVPRRREHGAFCSDLCRVWANRHPEDDLRKRRPTIVERHRGTVERAREDTSKESARIRAALLRAMADGQWSEPEHLCAVTGASWAAINPRLRDLRKVRYGGHHIERSGPLVNERGTKVYAYRLVKGERL